MIFELADTSTRDIAKQLVTIREMGNQVTTGRVLTLIVVTDTSSPIDDILHSINDSSGEHPSRVLVLIRGDVTATTRLDAEIRIGGDAGASEIIIMRVSGEITEHLAAIVTPLLLPDTPIVAWWPTSAPKQLAHDPIGQIAQRRITDVAYDPDPTAALSRRNHYTPGDSDLSWSRLTPWRGVLASALDQPPHEQVTSVDIHGPNDPAVNVAAGWLADRLAVPIRLHRTTHDCEYRDQSGECCHPISKIELHRSSGTVIVAVSDAHTMSVQLPGCPPSLVAVGRRANSDCLAEELRHLDPDNAYAKALRGLYRVQEV
ncbi:glucose-6-phosphate dehydrogenase assembly protein OpcA [Corynebacterium sp. H128]|uniref:glucose-6-phosphate dehydrogenase assembly protein OpcA n=1 Tax=unclassified Corynebacterium TaxID=2624378 RepID=UPI00309F7562